MSDIILDPTTWTPVMWRWSEGWVQGFNHASGMFKIKVEGSNYPVDLGADACLYARREVGGLAAPELIAGGSLGSILEGMDALILESSEV